jgi:hypothetical protein
MPVAAMFSARIFFSYAGSTTVEPGA